MNFGEPSGFTEGVVLTLFVGSRILEAGCVCGGVRQRPSETNLLGVFESLGVCRSLTSCTVAFQHKRFLSIGDTERSVKVYHSLLDLISLNT